MVSEGEIHPKTRHGTVGGSGQFCRLGRFKSGSVNMTLVLVEAGGVSESHFVVSATVSSISQR